MHRSIRELEPSDVDLIIDYFLNADHEFLIGMGVEPEKLPDRKVWREILLEDLERSVPDKKFYYLIWELDGSSIGHSNINGIVFGDKAFMHLHLWDPAKRRKGNGSYFIRECIARYFGKFNLRTLFCEPYANNPAPNRIMSGIGFEFLEKYDTTPGWINFHQTVNRWALTRNKWQQLSIQDTGLEGQRHG